MDSGTLTVTSNKGEVYVITVPAGTDVSAVQVGESVLVKLTAGEGDTWVAYSIKLVGNGNNDNKEKSEGFQYPLKS